MSGFKQVEGEYVIVVLNGVYKQVSLHERDGLLYAQASGGYVQLRADGSTNHDKIRFTELSWEGHLHQTKFGKLCRPDTVEGSARLGGDQQRKLLIGHDGSVL